MAYALNKKLAGLVPYAVDTGSYAVRLDANESFLTPPPALRDEMLQKMSQAALNRYPDPAAAGVCAAFADYYGTDPALVTAGNGLDEILFLLCNTFLCRGQKVLLALPDFSMYRFYAELAECTVSVYDKGESFTIDPDALIAQANREGADMLLFSNPCNPTSLGLDREAVRRIIRGVKALVVLDEAYMDFWDQTLIGEAGEYDNLILLRTCSKMVGLAGLRLGFAVANPTLTRALRAAKSPYNVGILPQTAGEVVLRDKTYLDACRDAVISSARMLFWRLSALGGKYGFQVFDTCTNFVMVRMPDAQDVFERLKAQSILVRCFGDCLRITAGTADENARLLEALETILKKAE